MAWTTPKTWAVGEILTAANMNLYQRDNTRWLSHGSTGGAPMCRFYVTTATTAANDTLTTLGSANPTVERFDNGGMHSTATNPSRITVPSGGGGLYLVGACALWSGSTAGYRELGLTRTGAMQYNDRRNAASVAVPTANSVAGLIESTAAGYFEAKVKQNSGASLTVTRSSAASAEVWAVWMGGTG